MDSNFSNLLQKIKYLLNKKINFSKLFKVNKSVSSKLSTLSNQSKVELTTPDTLPGRLSSLDALRGMNMLFILGVSMIIYQICSIKIDDFLVFNYIPDSIYKLLRWVYETHSIKWLANQMFHVYWTGCSIDDMVLPSFIFVAGVSLAFSISKSLSKGESKQKIYLKIIKRTFLLFIAGILYNNGLSLDWPNIRWMGVLQRIGLSLLLAGGIYIVFFKRMKILVSSFIVLIVSYWLFLCLVPAFDSVPSSEYNLSSFIKRGKDLFKLRKVALFTASYTPSVRDKEYPKPGSLDYNLLPEGNIVNWIDRTILPGKLFCDTANLRARVKGQFDPAVYRKLRDPEGLGSSIGSMLTALLGLIVGALMSTPPSFISDRRKLIYLLSISLLLIGVGYLWHQIFPVNKQIWSSSFICFSGGWACLMFSILYWIMDICGYKKWAFPFIFAGLNSLAIYLARKMIGFNNLTNFWFGDLIPRIVPHKKIVFSMGEKAIIETRVFVNICMDSATVLICVLILWWLYKKKIFLRFR